VKQIPSFGGQISEKKQNKTKTKKQKTTVQGFISLEFQNYPTFTVLKSWKSITIKYPLRRS